ncbi:MAG TPA: amidohydrolase family protein [Steroidobacteraceae bacterium]|nr:amidohydrolase family protein [Steroidobacteraceae bacterium]
MSPQQPADLLIEARWVLPVAPSTALFDHAVVVDSGRIVALGPSAELAARFAPRERAVRPDHVLLPGLINAHTRAGRTLLRGRPARSARSGPLADAGWVSADLVRDGAQLAAAEMLQAGITCFASRDLFPEEVARVAAAARMRAAIGLPVEERATAWAQDLTDHLAKAERLWDEYRSDPWVSLHFAPDAAPGLTDATLVRVRTVADELDARVMMPLHETEHEVRDSRARHAGASSVERLSSLGLLRPGFTALYASRLESSELELTARTGIAVVACPQASLRRALGFPRLTELLARGVAVGLGSGSPTDAFALDVLAEARTAALITSEASRAPDALPAERALELATLGGAAALGLKAIAGSIEPGKAADLIAIDLSSLGCQPDCTPAEAVLFGATRERVSDVWVGGVPRVAHGRLLAFDECEMLELARRWDERLAGGATPPARARAELRGAR